MQNEWKQRRLWQENQLVCLTSLEWSVKNVCEIHFPCMVFTRSLSEEQRAYIALFVNEKDVSVKQISQKTGISPTTIRSTNNTWNFCWIFRARDPTTLNNFPIAEIVNGQALAMNKSIKWREDEIFTKAAFLLFTFDGLLLKLWRYPVQRNTLWNLEMSRAITWQDVLSRDL